MFLCVYYQLNKTVTWFKTISQSCISGQKEPTDRLLGQVATNVLKKNIQMISLAGQLFFFFFFLEPWWSLQRTTLSCMKRYNSDKKILSGIYCNIIHKYSELLPIRQLNIPTLLNSGMAVWVTLAHKMSAELTCIWTET